MLEIRSALSTSLVSGNYGAPTNTTTNPVTSPLVLSERKLGFLYQISGWGQAEKNVKNHLNNLGFKKLPVFGMFKKLLKFHILKPHQIAR